MLEFEILKELEPNAEILEIIKDYDFTIKNGKIKHLKATNLQFIEHRHNIKEIKQILIKLEL